VVRALFYIRFNRSKSLIIKNILIILSKSAEIMDTADAGSVIAAVIP
jgi:hypothetical protein